MVVMVVMMVVVVVVAVLVVVAVVVVVGVVVLVGVSIVLVVTKLAVGVYHLLSHYLCKLVSSMLYKYLNRKYAFSALKVFANFCVFRLSVAVLPDAGTGVRRGDCFSYCFNISQWYLRFYSLFMQHIKG